MRCAAVAFAFLLGGGCAQPARAGEGAAKVEVRDLTCEFAVNPMGIDAARPRLSWKLLSDRRGEKQTAYRVLVASTSGKLGSDEGDLWDSGKIDSDRSVHVLYAGRGLGSGERAHWKVRVWDRDGKPSGWSAPAWWEMGLLKSEDWQGKWIGMMPATLPRPKIRPDLKDAEWIWADEPLKEKVRRFFHRRFDLRRGNIREAYFVIAVDDRFVLFVNGQQVAGARGWQKAHVVPVGEFLVPGEENVVSMVVRNGGGPAGVIARLVVEFESGEPLALSTDGSWLWAEPAWVPENPADEEWTPPVEDAKRWKKARVVAQFGKAPWKEIDQESAYQERVMGPAHYLRREFRVGKPVARARVYATAMGLYELHINGKKVGEDLFTPGWTDYNVRAQCQAYDVTDLLRKGGNALGLIVADGWFAGYLGGLYERGHFGTLTRSIVQLNVAYADGSTESVVTDGSWKGTPGPILYGDLYMGEFYDATREMPGWDEPRFDDSGWQAVTVHNPRPVRLSAQLAPTVKKIMEIEPVAITEPQKGVFVFDMGQNMVGFARLKVKGRKGTRVRLRFAEFLNPDGTVYTVNLRSARSTDNYVLNGRGTEVWEPRFTFHGFRYVEVTGYPGKPKRDAITGIVAHNDMKVTGSFECSSTMLNQLQKNILWGQRGNFLSVPTDCPQRDERLGWMGDAQIFCPTACFNMDVAGFFTKFVQDIRDTQKPDGRINDVAPTAVNIHSGAPAWADAGLIIPWNCYLRFADRRMLEETWHTMVRWNNYVLEENRDLIWRNRVGHNYGDWVSVGSTTPKDVLATAYFAHQTWILAEAAKVLGKTKDAQKYEDLLNRIKAAFDKAFVKEDGRVHGETQTCYALALHFNLLDEEKRKLAAKHLAEDLKKHENYLTTGFIGTRHLPHALAESGHLDIAYKLLLNEGYPSWGYSIAQGATTTWERWDGWTKEKGFQTPAMNSFNHYAFGAVGEFMYEKVAGIRPDPAKPGYKHIIIRPQPGPSLTRARAELESMYGKIASGWKVSGGTFRLDVTVPPNTTATVYLPVKPGSAVKAEGAKEVEKGVYTVGSGAYEFEVKD